MNDKKNNFTISIDVFPALWLILIMLKLCGMVTCSWMGILLWPVGLAVFALVAWAMMVLLICAILKFT